MNNNKEIILLKLGGSLLTDKNKPFSIREDVVKSAIRQIIEANEKLILIHGGGSFGHPLAKKYSISKGFDKSIPNQILGLAKTHQAMNKFNTYLINHFLEQNYPVLSIQASSIFIKDSEITSTKSLDIIETALDLNIMPILYGDIILDKQGSFSIISGDQIILALSQNLKNYKVSKVVFAMESDGLYVVDKSNSDNCKLVSECYSNELDSLDLADLGQKIDVTGGIKGKLDFIRTICKSKIPVQLINGLIEGYIHKSLKNQNLNCTNILINE
ncbi:MAG: isopentenyl phosphate kinase family protein [Candidatus Lokiarchaeota archaeon]|nr:isopentenyl phosphate kinase family protein [Candidatus Lokiarchaeota archaeon]